jgi:VIT1/CCC1 family predicted Fe2+/Mn2+ transporter
LADERAEAKVYRDLAARRSGEERQVLLGLAEAEARHAAHWERLLGDDVVPPRRGRIRMRLLALLARRFGSVFVLALAQQVESRSPYEFDFDATRAMAADERIHAEVVRGLAARGRARVSGTLRAAVFGANDGLVSNLALIVGVTGGGASPATVLLTGIPAAEAQRRAEALLREQPADARPVPPANGDQHEVVGTAHGAALSSFAFFASGAAVPVLPFLFGLTGPTALATSMVLVGLALMLTGATVGVLSGGPPVRRAMRQLAIGAGAAAATYLLGLLFSATVS